MTPVVPQKKAIIAFDGYTRITHVRGSKRSCDMFIYAVSWGTGTKIIRYTYGPEKTKAATFATCTALDLGKQLVNNFRNVNVRVIVGDHVESIQRLAASAAERELVHDMRQFVNDIKTKGPLGVLLDGLVK